MIIIFFGIFFLLFWQDPRSSVYRDGLLVNFTVRLSMYNVSKFDIFFSQLNLLEILTIFGGSIVISLRLLHAWVAFQLYLTVPYIWRVWKFVKFGIFEIIQLRIYLSSEVVPLCWPVSWMRSGLFPLLWTLSLSLSSFRRVLWGSDARTNLAFCLLDLEQRALRTRAMRMIMRTKTEMMARNIQTSGVTLRAWARLGLDLLSPSISLF